LSNLMFAEDSGIFNIVNNKSFGNTGIQTFSGISTIGAGLQASIYIIKKNMLIPNGESSLFWDNNTTERKLRNINRDATLNTFRMFGLIGLCRQASQVNYTTSDDVNLVIKSINENFSNIVENSNSKIVIDMSMDLLNLKSNTLRFLK